MKALMIINIVLIAIWVICVVISILVTCKQGIDNDDEKEMMKKRIQELEGEYLNDLNHIYKRLDHIEQDIHNYILDIFEEDGVIDTIWVVRDKRTKSEMCFEEEKFGAEEWLEIWLKDHPDEKPEDYEVVKMVRNE